MAVSARQRFAVKIKQFINATRMLVIKLNYQKVSHSMPTLREKAYEYVPKPRPISAMWTIEDKEFPGTLE